eukprot:Ihof_evm3s461 gene=Ihof_evmTU3s461
MDSFNTHTPEVKILSRKGSPKTINVYSKGRTTKEVYPQLKAVGMQSLTKLYRIGMGPSSSHTMGPRRAALRFKSRFPLATKAKVELFGSLAATGKGHMTDKAILDVLGHNNTELVWLPDETLPLHPNGMRFSVIDPVDDSIQEGFECYSVGGGALVEPGDLKRSPSPGNVEGRTWEVYELNTMNQLLEWCETTGRPLHEYVYENEQEEEIKKYLAKVWEQMETTRDNGLRSTGVLPGGLCVPRKANGMYKKLRSRMGDKTRCTPMLFAYALAVMEENASGGIVVTAPTCGSCGVIPSVISYISKHTLPDTTHEDIINALATAGLVGNVTKTNASISGAEVGCQGEVGTAASMAAAAAAYLMGGSPNQIEYAAEMAMEHFLGLTCDPVEGLVQIPCIERNVFAASRAIDAAEYALLSDGRHRISFDEVVLTMKMTGLDIEECYRETAKGGLASTYNLDERLKK